MKSDNTVLYYLIGLNVALFALSMSISAYPSAGINAAVVVYLLILLRD